MGYNAARRRERATVTYEGGRAFTMDPKLELYLLVVSSLMSGDSFYESDNDRLERFRRLVTGAVDRDVVDREDGPKFLMNLAAYARHEMHLRTTPTILTTELFLTGCEWWGAETARNVWVRGDEHLEALAYLDAVGAKRPKAFLRAVARRLGSMTEYQFVKYASGRKSYSQKDAICLSHPVPDSKERSALYKYVVHGWASLSEEEQAMLPEVKRLKDGESMTWEQHISKHGSTGEAWNEALGKMGYMALLRNLRNFVEKGVDQASLAAVANRLSDPDAVKNSKQLPFRFLSAYRSLPHGTPSFLSDAVARAADHAVFNVPELEGESLVLVDVSGSMTWTPVSRHSSVSCAEAAASLAAILKKVGNCDLWAFATEAGQVRVPSGTPVLATTDAIKRMCVGGATYFAEALQKSLRPGFARVIVLSDMQCQDDAHRVLANYLEGADCRAFLVDLSSYGRAAIDPRHPKMVTVGGFSDRVFQFMAAMERKAPLTAIETYLDRKHSEGESPH